MQLSLSVRAQSRTLSCLAQLGVDCVGPDNPIHFTL